MMKHKQQTSRPEKSSTFFGGNNFLGLNLYKIKTQKKTIARIIKDINSMKSSVELSRESLKRIDSGTEDLVFQDAKKNSSSKVIYKLLVDLRENYDNLIRIVEEQYKLQTKISDFEIRIEAVMARNSKHDIEQLRSDLEKVKSES